MEFLNQCRCCLVRPSERELNARNTWLGRPEIYNDMLKECYEIYFSLGETDDDGICTVCIVRLRDALDFKKQVLKAQKDFLARKSDFNFANVKVELDDVKAEMFNSDDNEDTFEDLKQEPSPEAVTTRRLRATRKPQEKKLKQRSLTANDTEIVKKITQRWMQ